MYKYSDNNQYIFILKLYQKFVISLQIIIYFIIIIIIIMSNIIDIIINSIGDNIITPTIPSNYTIDIIPIKIIGNNTINYYYIR